MEEILSLHGLKYTYPNGTEALKGIELSIGRGERVAVLGGNGCGKSTLFLCLNGILRPKEGEIRFAGAPLCYDKKGLTEIRRKVGIVFQDPETQLFCVDVFQEVAFGPHNMGIRKEALTRLVDQNLEHLDLTALRGQPPHFLSYGQKKRVSIASVLAMEPEVLIFDEPTAALDPLHARQMLELLETFSVRGITILMSTHDVDIAHEWADRVVVMRDGRVLGDGVPDAVFTNPALLEQGGLCPPAVLRIFTKLVNCGVLAENLPPPRSIEQLEQYL